MSLYRPFSLFDLLRFNNVNLDPLTETYGLAFYLQYLVTWPEYFQTAESASGRIMGYIMGKSEGREQNWHGHVTAVTVAPEYRRLGLGARLMSFLERVSDAKQCLFVDLFVRQSNKVAHTMYGKLGYVVYRRVLQYYQAGADDATFVNDEDAFDMRKALSADRDGSSIRTEKRTIRVIELENN